MGRLGAEAMAAVVADGDASLRMAMHWHMRSNHYPPYPAFMVEPALAAVAAANDGDWDRIIDLPKDGDTPMVEWRDGRTAIEAHLIIESFHLDSFIDYEEGEY